MTYRQIHGHEAQISFLKQIVATEKIAHAYLFYGPEGIGKKRVALLFAASLFCPTPSSPGEGCGVCHSCERAEKGIHPDLIMISPRGATIGIEDIRDTIMATTIRPLEGVRRVVIIDDADKMSEPAANAVLKTLEEPKRGNIFVLITARPHKLLSTIVSRLQPLHFSPLSREILSHFLVEKHHLPREKAEVISTCAGGSVSKALELSKEEYLSFREKTRAIFKQAANLGFMAPMMLARFFIQDKTPLEDKLFLLSTLFRDALRMRETGSEEGIINVDFIEIIRLFAERLEPVQMIKNIQILTQAQMNLEQNANKTLTLDASLFSLTYL